MRVVNLAIEFNRPGGSLPRDFQNGLGYLTDVGSGADGPVSFDPRLVDSSVQELELSLILLISISLCGVNQTNGVLSLCACVAGVEIFLSVNSTGRWSFC